MNAYSYLPPKNETISDLRFELKSKIIFTNSMVVYHLFEADSAIYQCAIPSTAVTISFAVCLSLQWSDIIHRNSIPSGTRVMSQTAEVK